MESNSNLYIFILEAGDIAEEYEELDKFIFEEEIFKGKKISIQTASIFSKEG
jgi:hypothetical protein